MHKRLTGSRSKGEKTEQILTVNTDILMQMLDSGRTTAVEIGTKAGARIQVGRRVMWYVPKVEAYLAALAE